MAGMTFASESLFLLPTGATLTCLHFLSNRQKDPEGGAFTRHTFCRNIALVIFYYPLHNSQPDTGAGLFVAMLREPLKDLKDLFCFFRRKTLAVVPELHQAILLLQILPA